MAWLATNDFVKKFVTIAAVGVVVLLIAFCNEVVELAEFATELFGVAEI